MSPLQWAIVIAGTIVLAAGVVSAALAYDEAIRTAFTYAHQTQIPQVVHEQVAAVRRIAPAGSRFIWINRTPEGWFSRVWQRLLYPDPVFFVENHDDLEALFELTREKHGVHFVFSAGSPPLDPGYSRRVSLVPPPGAPGELWFGVVGADNEWRDAPEAQEPGQ